MNWQPIATAPSGYQFLLLHVPGQLDHGGHVTVGVRISFDDERDERGRFKRGQWYGMDSDTGAAIFEPTHWMPLPEPPQ